MTTSGSRGGRTRRAPPLTAADLWFCNAQNAYFSHFFPRSLRSQFILSLNLIDIWSKHAKIDFYFKPSTLSMICYPPPSPVDKVHAPPKVKSWIRHWWQLYPQPHSNSETVHASEGAQFRFHSYKIKRTWRIYPTFRFPYESMKGLPSSKGAKSRKSGVWRFLTMIFGC